MDAPASPPAVAVVGRITAPMLDETSGCAVSRSLPGVVWAHNDSGDRSRLFAIDESGRVLGPPPSGEVYEGLQVEPAKNKDWEDLAWLDGKLVVADTGNNDNERHDLRLYVVPEADPRVVRQVAPEQTWAVAFPKQFEFPPKGGAWTYDAEALFGFRGHLYLLTKHRAGADHHPSDATELYRLDDPKAGVLNLWTWVDQRAELGGWVTSADLSPQGDLLAVLVERPTRALWLFPTPADGSDRFLSASTGTRLPLGDVGQVEAVCWKDDRTAYVLSEEGVIRSVTVR